MECNLVKFNFDKIMKKIVFISLGLLIGLNFIVTINSIEGYGDINMNLLKAHAQYPEYDPPGQIEIEVNCQIWTYGCWYCESGDGWCVVSGIMIDCVDQYVCPSCTCTPSDCIPIYNC